MSFGGAVKLTGESEYKKALTQITQSLKVVSAEMKATSASFSAGEKSEKDMAQSGEALSKALNEQKNALATLKAQLPVMISEYQKTGTAHQALVQKYDDEKAKLTEIKSTLGESSKEYKDQEKIVAELAVEVEKSQKAYDAQGKALNDMRIKTANAETTVSQTAVAIDKLGKETEDSAKSAERAGDGYTVFKGILANLGTQAITSAINGIKKLGSTLVGVGKQSLSGFAEMEQLEGGVRKIFGADMAETVSKNASQAFKTAGMSANEYMETVTGFSASLIQSLNGDTAKSAEIADRAIRDMSDNANTYGTDIKNIQNAYQGFAKQNYTMLDNLKLGYGGNKTEMQRLIKDASQLDKVQKELGVTIDANDMSFANIANAISVVQRNMGIMGTTTIEASGTIQGATGSMQSAWKNLLTGFADENANFTQLSKDFIGTLITEDGKGGVLGTIIPRVAKVIGGMSEALSTTLPQLLQTIAPVIQAQLPTLITAVQSGLSTILGVLVTGITEAIPKLAEYVPVLVQTISTGIEKNLVKIIQTATKIIVSLINGLTKALPQLVAMIPTIIKTIVVTLIKNAPQVLQCGKDILTSLISGIGSMLGALTGKISSVGRTIVSAFKGVVASAVSIGKNLVEGIWNGISNGYEWIKSKIRGWVGNVTSFIKNLFGISSPSKLFRDEIGKNLALGVGVGFTDQMKTVSKTMGDAIPTSLGESKATARFTARESGTDVVRQFEEALSRMKIVLDDEVAGKFVERTVTRVIYA